MKKIDFELLDKQIFYKSGYKYQLEKDTSIKIKLNFIKKIDIRFLIYDNEILTVKAGYAWNGPSGPTIDTKDFMRGSLFHDVLYQLIREGYISKDYRSSADALIYGICKIDGMNIIRRSYVYSGVSIFGNLWNNISDDTVESAP